MNKIGDKKLPEWLKKGAKVNYYYYSDGTIHKQECTIEAEPFLMAGEDIVVLLDIIPGCVPIELISPIK